MGDVTSTCCQNTTQMQQMGITRQVNMDQPISEQVFTYEAFHQLADSLRETFKEAVESKFFKKPAKEFSLDNNSEVWNGQKIITIIKKYKSFQRQEKTSIFQMSSSSPTGRFCSYIKSLQSDNTITQNDQLHPKKSLPLLSQPINKSFTGLFLLYFPNKQYFLGNLTQNQPTNGIFLFKPGCYYVGNIQNLTASGQGSYKNQQNGYVYEGMWSKNLQHGKGKEYYQTSNQTFEGEFMYGSKFGIGKYTFSDGRVYQGYFYNGHSDGQGRLTISSKQYYAGQWKLGSIQGKGEYHYPNGDVYYGQFENGLKSGKGRYVFSAGFEYDGEWLDGKMHGTGVIKEGYDEIEGEWVEGKKVA